MHRIYAKTPEELPEELVTWFVSVRCAREGWQQLSSLVLNRNLGVEGGWEGEMALSVCSENWKLLLVNVQAN